MALAIRRRGWALVSALVLSAALVVAPLDLGAGAGEARSAPAHSLRRAAGRSLTGKVNTPGDALNLRSCASTSCSVLRRVPHGTVLTLGRTSGDWFRTSYGGTSGWVSSWYVVLLGSPASTISHGNPGRRMIAYTFDAGSDFGFTGQILDFLRREGITTTFGLTGGWAARHPDHVRWIAGEGHQLINHTWTHRSLTGTSPRTAPLSPAVRTWELRRTDRKVKRLTGASTRPFFRPPYGDYDSGVLNDVGANRYRHNLMWSLDSLGWRGLSAADICNRVIFAVGADRYEGNGFIILFHVGSASRDAEALPCITRGLRDRGFSFGTVEQVLAP